MVTLHRLRDTGRGYRDRMTLAGVEELVSRWNSEAIILDRRGAKGQANLMRSMIDDLREALRSGGDEILTIPQAATISGYTPDHLRRLVKGGTIPNLGRPNAPRVRRADLPIKPRKIAEGRPGGYDPIADARSLLSRRKGGA